MWRIFQQCIEMLFAKSRANVQTSRPPAQHGSIQASRRKADWRLGVFADYFALPEPEIPARLPTIGNKQGQSYHHRFHPQIVN